MIMRRMVGESSTTRMVLISGGGPEYRRDGGVGETNVPADAPDGEGDGKLDRRPCEYAIDASTRSKLPRMQTAPGEDFSHRGRSVHRPDRLPAAHPGASGRNRVPV